MNYNLNQEDKSFISLITSNDFFLHSLLPNQTNIFPLLYIDNKVIEYVKQNYNSMGYLLYPVFKHLWSEKKLFVTKKTNFSRNTKQLLICSDEDEKICLTNNEYQYFNLQAYNKKTIMTILSDLNNISIINNRIEVQGIDLIFTFEAFSFFFLHIVRKIDTFNINFFFILGVVESCKNLACMSIPFKQSAISFYNKYNFRFDSIKLKSLFISNQIRIFDVWKKKQDVIVVGGTGTGKTSQVPKVFWWINFWFDGFEDIDFDKFIFDLDEITKKKIKKRETILSLPRKMLINLNCEHMYRSLGFTNIYDSPINCKYKDVKSTKFYNPNVNKFISPFIFSVNQSTTFDNLNTIIFDEIHEHDKFTDIGIAIVKKTKTQKNIRNLVLITATITDDLENLIKFLPNIVMLQIKGDTLFAIEDIDMSHKVNKENNYQGIEKIIKTYSIEKGKSTLLFLSSVSLINQFEERLKKELLPQDYVIKKLHRELVAENNDLVNEFYLYPKQHVIILSTPIAESSITINNAKVVIDSGLFFYKEFFSGSTIYITRSMLEQRKGRVGRISSGTYIRLFSSENINKFFKKIDYEFLLPYIIRFLYYGLSFEDDIYIKPSDMERFQRTIDFFKYRGVNLKKHIKSINYIFNNSLCELPEYLIIYFKGTKEQKQNLFHLEEETNMVKKIMYIRNNLNIFKTIAKTINIEVSTINNNNIKLKKFFINDNKFVFVFDAKIQIRKYYENITPFNSLILSDDSYLFLLSQNFSI